MATCLRSFAAAMVVGVLLASAAVEGMATAAVPPGVGGGADLLPVAGRPLAANVSVFTDGTYGPVESIPPQAGCPTAFAIAGAVTTSGTQFFIPAARVTVNGEACTGPGDAPGLAGVFGAGLPAMDAAVVAALNLTGLFAVDPKGAILTGATGPLTCGGTAWAGEFEFFALWRVGPQGRPQALYRVLANPRRRCALVVDI